VTPELVPARERVPQLMERDLLGQAESFGDRVPGTALDLAMPQARASAFAGPTTASCGEDGIRVLREVGAELYAFR
jgi:hypothetical protein